MHIEDHHITLYTSAYGNWATCDCGWQSTIFRYRSGAQHAWSVHVARLIRGTLVTQ